MPGRGDVLIGTNGDRFTGRVISETAESVIFESELAGRLTIPRARIRELQRVPTSEIPSLSPFTNAPPTTASQSTNNLWRPPGVGKDGSDWLELKSGEWLRGELRYIQHRKVEFDSDELNDSSLKLKDIRQVLPSKPMFTKFEGRDDIYGTVVISNETVQVFGPEQLNLSRDQLTGITPGGKREIDFWSAKASIGLNLQSGNTRQANMSASAELARRTPSTLMQLDYLGNYSVVQGTENVNNHRLTTTYDIRLNRHWFLQPLWFEYYLDPVANIAHRETVAVGVGYYIFDQDGLEWNFSGGPGYQNTRFKTVEFGQDSSASTPAGVLQSSFKIDLTRKLKFNQTFSATVMSEHAGTYSHHTVSALEFEIKRHLDLDVSFVWDYLQNPQPEAGGAIPQHSDFRLNVGLGVRY